MKKLGRQEMCSAHRYTPMEYPRDNQKNHPNQYKKDRCWAIKRSIPFEFPGKSIEIEKAT